MQTSQLAAFTGRNRRAACIQHSQRRYLLCRPQYLVQALADSGYGAPDLGGVSLTKWLGDGTAVKTLLAGLFRPVDAVSRRVEDTAAQIFSQPGQVNHRDR